jgi:hypothetical protein
MWAYDILPFSYWFLFSVVGLIHRFNKDYASDNEYNFLI